MRFLLKIGTLRAKRLRAERKCPHFRSGRVRPLSLPHTQLQIREDLLYTEGITERDFVNAVYVPEFNVKGKGYKS